MCHKNLYEVNWLCIQPLAQVYSMKKQTWVFNCPLVLLNISSEASKLAGKKNNANLNKWIEILSSVRSCNVISIDAVRSCLYLIHINTEYPTNSPAWTCRDVRCMKIKSLQYVEAALTVAHILAAYCLALCLTKAYAILVGQTPNNCDTYIAPCVSYAMSNLGTVHEIYGQTTRNSICKLWASQ